MKPTLMMTALLVVGLATLFCSFTASVDFLLQSDKRLHAFLTALVGFFFFSLALACVLAVFQGKQPYRTVSGLLCFFNAIAFGMAVGIVRNLSDVVKPDNLIVIGSGVFLSAFGILISGLGAALIS